MDKKTMSFQAKVQQLLHLVTHSLYSIEEIFLREMVSDASDACNKLRFEALDKPELKEDQSELNVRVYFGAEAKTTTIRDSDSGIGMIADEVVAHLGTVAKSGTREFLGRLEADKIRRPQRPPRSGNAACRWARRSRARVKPDAEAADQG